MTFLWLLFTTTIGAIAGGMVYASPWIGSAIGFVVGFILNMIIKSATGNFGFFGEDPFNFDGGYGD
jgi:hypothetical protein